MSELIGMRDAVDAILGLTNCDTVDELRAYVEEHDLGTMWSGGVLESIEKVERLSSAEPERLTDDDFETIRIHLNAYKEKLCNQQRWEEAKEYQRIIDRFMAFASEEPERKTGEWIYYDSNGFQCSRCRRYLEISCGDVKMNFCPHCGSYNRGEQDDSV